MEKSAYANFPKIFSFPSGYIEVRDCAYSSQLFKHCAYVHTLEITAEAQYS